MSEVSEAPKGPYVVRRTTTGFETWSTKGLPFAPTSWQKTWRDELVAELRRLPASQGLRGVYTSLSPQPVDVENVLFYNVGLAPFRHLTVGSLVFERVMAAPPAPPEGLQWSPLHHLRYSRADHDDDFAHWRVDRLLASWNAVAIPDLASSTLTAARVWARTLATTVVLQGEPPQHFGLRIRLRGTKGRPLSAIVKPLLDGVISSFHGFNAAIPDPLVQRVASASGLGHQEAVSRLQSARQPVLGARLVVRTTKDGISWNPRDDDCVACAISADNDGPPEMSGELFAVADVENSDARLWELDPPYRRWSDSEWARLQRGNHPRDMDDRWWIIAVGSKLRIHRFWTGRLVFEASFRRGERDWAVDQAWIRSDLATPDDTDLLRAVIDGEFLGLM